MQDIRLIKLEKWLNQRLADIFKKNNWGDVPTSKLIPASSDASFRRYFRWQSDRRSFIVMDAPPEVENCLSFVSVAHLLARENINVPDILASDIENGFLLLTDLGDKTYLDVINTESAEVLFAGAITSLLQFQKMPLVESLPLYDKVLLERELQLFPDWYVSKHLEIKFSLKQSKQWSSILNLLVDQALQQPKVFVHRDYMPRNLMISVPNPGVLDFQDAVYGPVTYDATSLFKDAFLSWPQKKVDRWLYQYWVQAKKQSVPVHDQWDDFLRASDLMGVQRHLKVIGIFSRIFYRDGKNKYIQDIPRFFSYINQVISRRPELSELDDLLRSLPIFEFKL